MIPATYVRARLAPDSTLNVARVYVRLNVPYYLAVWNTGGAFTGGGVTVIV
jgi:hypothetical protein